jgi:hypothetical protein
LDSQNKGKATHFVSVLMEIPRIGVKQYLFFVKHNVILGIPWMKAHCATIDWVGWTILIGPEKIPLQTKPAPLTLEISATEFEREMKEEGSMGFLVFVNEILVDTHSSAQELLNPKVAQLLDEYKDHFLIL